MGETMTAEITELVRFTVFAVVIGLVVALGTLEATRTSEKNHPRRGTGRRVGTVPARDRRRRSPSS
jgi:hypothetical protein